MNEEIEAILRKMGWTGGLHLPVANDENKALQNELERLMLTKAKATLLFQKEESRLGSLEKHLKFVREQSEDNQVCNITSLSIYTTSFYSLMLVLS